LEIGGCGYVPVLEEDKGTIGRVREENEEGERRLVYVEREKPRGEGVRGSLFITPSQLEHNIS